MRIISPFKDFYDSGMAFGQEAEPVYVRKTEVIRKVDDKTAWINLPNFGSGYSLPPIKHERSGNYGYINKSTLYFCGQAYSFYIIEKGVNHFITSFDKDFCDYVEPRLLWNDKEYKLTPDHFKTQPRNSPKANLFFRSPVVIYTNVRMQGDEYMARSFEKFIINPCMKNFHMQKLFTPFDAFQEISMYIGNILTNNNDPVDNRTSLEKVQSHGFDKKFSFRKMPHD